MATQSFEVSARSATAPPRLFELLADAKSWPAWAGPIIREAYWEREGTPAPGGVGAIRKVGGKPFYGREEVIEYEPPHRYVYTMLSGQPVRDYRAVVELTPDGTGTLIRWRSTFRPVIPGTGGLMRSYLRRIIAGFAKRLAAQT
jgi:uncharacterized protein YndB with AHSA1/START domain